MPKTRSAWRQAELRFPDGAPLVVHGEAAEVLRHEGQARRRGETPEPPDMENVVRRLIALLSEED
jgi:hypothetical protein